MDGRRRASAVVTAVELDLHGFTHGGEAVGRLPNGKACFVPYGIPGERVLVEVTEEHKRWARAELRDVLEESPDRVDAPCPYFGPGRCGGCKLQHIAPERQARLLRRVVTDQLERIGKVPEPPVAETVRPHPDAGLGYRNRARFAVDETGRLAFRRAGSRELIPIDRCLLLTDDAQAAREAAGDSWEGVEEVVVRSGTGPDRALEVTPGSGGMSPLPDEDVPVALIDAAGQPVVLRGAPTTSHEVAGRTFTVAPTSFFQSSHAGAEALVDLVRRGVRVQPGETVLDLYAGVGLFSAALAGDGAEVTAVESAPSSAADAEANLSGLDVDVVREDVGRFVQEWVRRGHTVDAVVLDPPRRGAGTQVCRELTGLRPRVIAYVSCDPAALARDALALTDAGYGLGQAVPVDQFTHTAHVETVAFFRPSA